jgi:hypothetical protein
MSSSNYATAALVESAHGWLVHRCHHRPPLPRECDHRDDEPHGGGGVEPGRGRIQHQQLMPNAHMLALAAEHPAHECVPHDGVGARNEAQHVILRHEAARP